MSLPWFPFNIKDFLANTKRLNTEAKGAYLCLMLDYYEQEGPAPDDDDVLAAICELPVDAWKRHRKVIAPLFQITDGFWRHDRIEREIEFGNSKLASSKARAQAGAAAMHLKKGHKLARSMPQASPELASSIKPATSQLEAQLKQSLEDAHLHLHKESSLSVCSDVAVEKDNSGDNSDDQEGADQEESLGAQVDPQFWPCANHIATCGFDGADAETINREIDAFIATHQERGTFSHDWDASWSMWWKRWRDHRDAQAKKAPKPRVEVSNAPPDWNAHAIRWANGMGWPRGVGGEPGSARCRCPPEVLTANGIDPATGLKLVPEKV